VEFERVASVSRRLAATRVAAIAEASAALRNRARKPKSGIRPLAATALAGNAGDAVPLARLERDDAQLDRGLRT
jgi:hypothetical protein